MREFRTMVRYRKETKTDVELGLDTTRSDDLEILRMLESGGGEHTSKRKGLGLGPKTKC